MKGKEYISLGMQLPSSEGRWASAPFMWTLCPQHYIPLLPANQENNELSKAQPGNEDWSQPDTK